MPDPDYSKYEEAIARALDFEHRQDPYNALEWCVVALRHSPSDPVALRHKARAQQEIARLKAGGQTSPTPLPSLSLNEREALEKHLLLAESFIANGANRLAERELRKAIQISTNHPHLQRLCQQLGLQFPSPDTEIAVESAYASERTIPQAESQKKLLIRRIGVAKSLIKSGQKEAARSVLLRLRDSFGPLSEITELLDRL